jgi:superfamily I DNA/RNA helicase
MPLSTAQLNAAHDPADIVRLVAGPGTGKSKSIEERVSWLINQKVQKVPPTSIYVLSFTKFASEDLGKRIKKHCAEVGLAAQADAIQISTAHSLALKMLRNAHLLTHFPVDPIVMDSWEAKNIFASEFSVFANEASPQTDEYQRQHGLNGLARIGMRHILGPGGYVHADDTGTAARPCVAGY